MNQTAARGGKVVIPAFAIERTQELVFYFHLLVDQKRIPEIPIWVDSPMAINATSIFQIHPECYDEETHEAFGKAPRESVQLQQPPLLVRACRTRSG